MWNVGIEFILCYGLETRNGFFSHFFVVYKYDFLNSFCMVGVHRCLFLYHFIYMSNCDLLIKGIKSFFIVNENQDNY